MKFIGKPETNSTHWQSQFGGTRVQPEAFEQDVFQHSVQNFQKSKAIHAAIVEEF